MDRYADKRKKKKQPEQSVPRPPPKRIPPPRPPPKRIPPPMPPPKRIPQPPVQRMPTNYNYDKRKLDMMRQQIRSNNQIKDAQMEQIKRKNMEMQQVQLQQRQQQIQIQQRQTEQRQMANARIAQMNEQNVRVSGAPRRP
jgi:hypothetical protein